MVSGGLGGAKSRRQQRLERALSASSFMPIFAFAALGTLTVFLVALLGMPQLGVVIGRSAPDAGLVVTAPRMTVTIAPPPAQPPVSPGGRDATKVDSPPAVVADEQTDAVAVVFAVQPSSPATVAPPAPSPSPSPSPSPAPSPSPSPAPSPSPEPDPPALQPRDKPETPAIDETQSRSREGKSAREEDTDQRVEAARCEGTSVGRAFDDGARSGNGSRHAAKRSESVPTSKDEKRTRPSKQGKDTDRRN